MATLNVKTLARSYAIARRAELAGCGKVDAFVAANYPAADHADDRKAFERKVMLPFEMARLVEKKQPGADGAALVAAFMAQPGYSKKPEGGSDMFDAYRAAVVSVQRLLERAGFARGATRADKGKPESKARRAAKAAAKAAKEAPAPEAKKPVKVVARQQNIKAPTLREGEGVIWAREIIALVAHTGKTNAGLGGDDGEIFRRFVAGVVALTKELPAKE